MTKDERIANKIIEETEKINNWKFILSRNFIEDTSEPEGFRCITYKEKMQYNKLIKESEEIIRWFKELLKLRIKEQVEKMDNKFKLFLIKFDFDDEYEISPRSYIVKAKDEDEALEKLKFYIYSIASNESVIVEYCIVDLSNIDSFKEDITQIQNEYTEVFMLKCKKCESSIDAKEE